MSLQKAQTALPGYGLPLCSFEGKDELTEVLDAHSFNKLKLNSVASRVAGYLGYIPAPTTEDGYCWFSGQRFRVDEAEIVVLIPWAQDWDRSDDCNFDRAIGIYAKGTVVGISAPTSLIHSFAEEVARELTPAKEEVE